MATARPQPAGPRPSLGGILSLPPRALSMYGDFIAKNAGQVSQIESALRSLTYIIPGRFRDAEIASESIHSAVQLLSLYHDTLLRQPLPSSSSSPLQTQPQTQTQTRTQTPPIAPSPHARYTKFWTEKSGIYRRVAYVLNMVVYTQLLCEMAAKRRGDRTRWRVVVLLEAVKALCRLILLRTTRSRPLVTPVLPEREPIPEDAAAAIDEDQQQATPSESELLDQADDADAALLSWDSTTKPHEKSWRMPRTGMTVPKLPNPGDISSYLLGKVLTADDVKPAFKLLSPLSGPSQLAEILHILSPLIYALALYRAHASSSSSSRAKASWTPWLVGIAVEYAARQLRDRSLRSPQLEREEWDRRAWGMGWWCMRGAFYDNVMRGVVGGVKRRVPGFVGGILDDYEYLWDNYYFATSA